MANFICVCEEDKVHLAEVNHLGKHLIVKSYFTAPLRSQNTLLQEVIAAAMDLIVAAGANSGDSVSICLPSQLGFTLPVPAKTENKVTRDTEVADYFLHATGNSMDDYIGQLGFSETETPYFFALAKSSRALLASAFSDRGLFLTGLFLRSVVLYNLVEQYAANATSGVVYAGNRTLESWYVINGAAYWRQLLPLIADGQANNNWQSEQVDDLLPIAVESDLHLFGGKAFYLKKALEKRHSKVKIKFMDLSQRLILGPAAEEVLQEKEELRVLPLFLATVLSQ